MKTYKSKIGIELLIPLIIILGGIFVLFLFLHIWFGAVIITAVAVFTAHMFFTTRYTIDNTTLSISCGLFYKKIVDIRTIQSVQAVKNAMSAPAASLDRIELRIKGSEPVIISPRDKEEFLLHLLSVNNTVTITVFK